MTSQLSEMQLAVNRAADLKACNTIAQEKFAQARSEHNRLVVELAKARDATTRTGLAASAARAEYEASLTHIEAVSFMAKEELGVPQ